MDVKGTFLNELLKDEVHISQSKCFQNLHYPDHVLKIKESLYGFKQAPRVWYNQLTIFLLNFGFSRGIVDKTLLLKKMILP